MLWTFVALTIGIGATTTIFSVVNGVLLAPLPLPDAENLLRVTGLDRNNQPIQISLPDSLDIKHRLRSADGFAFYQKEVRNLADRTRPEMVHTLEVDAAIFAVMGVKMAQGAPFSAGANQPGSRCETVLAWTFWQRQFGALPMVGQTIRLNGRPCLVDGILPRNLDLPVAADLWESVPIELRDLANARSARSWFAIARLKSGSSLAAFNSDLAAISRELSRENPKEDNGVRFQGIALRDWLTGVVAPLLWTLFAAVTGVLLIACANVANLMLVRASDRSREIAVRIAVGASRSALVRQWLTESLLLASLSALAGLLLTFISIPLLKNLPNAGIPRSASIVVDWRVLLAGVFAAVLTGLLFGTLPALRVSRIPLTGVLKQSAGRMTDTPRQQWIRKLLIVAETAVATVLLIVSLLLLQSFRRVSRVDPGFETSHLLTAYLSLPPDSYGGDTLDSDRFAKKVVDRLSATPGIAMAALTTNLPLQTRHGGGPVQIEGQAKSAGDNDSPFVIYTDVTTAYCKTLGVRLLAGRDLEPVDDREDADAVLVNAAFAETFFPTGDAMGKRLRLKVALSPRAPWQRIVGVIANTRQDGLERAVQPEVYIPLSRDSTLFPAVVIRTADRPALHQRDIENAVHWADANVPVFSVLTMEQIKTRSLGLRTLSTSLLAVFACIALLLASVGIFAVIAYSVSRRTSEMGTRLALGASRAHIIFMILRQGAMPAIVGIAAGVLAALIVTRYLSGLLFGILPEDLASYAGAVILLMVVAIAAALLPALRASRVDPLQALRYE